MSDISETALKLELLQVDILLKRKPAFWETPRNIAILLATVAAVSGTLGFRFGQQQSPQIIFAPGSVQVKP